DRDEREEKKQEKERAKKHTNRLANAIKTGEGESEQTPEAIQKREDVFRELILNMSDYDIDEMFGEEDAQKIKKIKRVMNAVKKGKVAFFAKDKDGNKRKLSKEEIMRLLLDGKTVGNMKRYVTLRAERMERLEDMRKQAEENGKDADEDEEVKTFERQCEVEDKMAKENAYSLFSEDSTYIIEQDASILFDENGTEILNSGDATQIINIVINKEIAPPPPPNTPPPPQKKAEDQDQQ
ncbi:MAG: hypothetical protein LBS34_01295, partial [Rickettsiales bacterium]|nr:hypothetical protein [Rickettsiales bacterium]